MMMMMMLLLLFLLYGVVVNCTLYFRESCIQGAFVEVRFCRRIGSLPHGFKKGFPRGSGGRVLMDSLGQNWPIVVAGILGCLRSEQNKGF